MKTRAFPILTILAAVTILVVGCPDPVNPPVGPFVDPVVEDPIGSPLGYYEIHDYDLPADGSWSVDVVGLSAGDRVFAIPLYAAGGESGAPAQRTVMSLKATYSGETVPPFGRMHPKAGTPNVRNLVSRDFRDLVIDTEGYPPARSWAREHGAYLPPPSPRTIGETASFWAIDDVSGPSTDVALTATLMYEGPSCYVYFRTATLAGATGASALAALIGDAFEQDIYPATTGMFGYEWGGDPAGPPGDDGGIDGDRKVYILVQDVTANCGGYFSERNEYTDAQAVAYWNRHSNGKELINVVLSASDIAENLRPLDTIAHELQHLVEYNRFKRRLGTSQTAFVNEGLSQVAESVNGYGPEIPKLNMLQADPRVSYSKWSWDAPYGIQNCYASGYAVIDYGTRRFGADFVRGIMSSPSTGISGVSAVLADLGYAEGWAGLMLDALSAGLLDRDEYSYPASDAYLVQRAIDLDGATPMWTSTGGQTYLGMLFGPKTNFTRSYPKTWDVRLFDWGADYYELVSGANGTITVACSDIESDTKLRLIVMKSEARPTPLVDGYSGDWASFDPVSTTDPANDNSPGLAEGDITKVTAFRESGTLFMAIECRAPPFRNDDILWFQVDLDLVGDAGRDFIIMPMDFYLHTYDGSGVRIELDSGGARYRMADVFELAIPLSMFGVTPKDPIIITRVRATCVVDSVSYPDNAVINLSVPL
ncbi:MAG: hypothetical protein NT080_09050 [Spirochaetes bacterium]|nr:hypothetical protein [Spirochaetota bacterium]